MAAIGFLAGMQNGMDMTFGLLDKIDQRRRANTQEQWANDDRRYLLSYTRPTNEKFDNLKLRDTQNLVNYNEERYPLLLQDTRLGIEDKQGQVAYNRQVRPFLAREVANKVNWAEEDRPLERQTKELGLQDYQGQVAQNGLLRTWAKDDRSLDRRSKELELQDKESLVNYNTQYRPVALQDAKDSATWKNQERDWAKEDRPQDVAERQWKFDTLKNEEARQKAAERRTQQDHNLKLAERQYAAAIAAYQAGDEQGAVNLMQQADDLSGGLFSGMATGANSRMATLADEVATGKRSPKDPEFIRATQDFTRPTMRTSGRDQDYTMDGVEALPNGKVGYTMSPKSMDAIMNRIRQVESTGNATATNPRSSATGAEQFIESTWLSMMHKYEPRLIQGKSTAQILEMRKDPELSRAMGRRYAEENAAYLEKNGIATTAQSVYAAHHFGAQGAVDMFKADPRTPMVKIVGERSIEANPHLKNKSLGQVLGWVQRKMQVPATHGMSSEPDDPVVAYDQNELLGRVKQGVAMEQQFNQTVPPKLKEALAARAAGMGISTAKPATKEDVKQWSKLDDGTLYNEYTGETKTVKSGTGTTQTNGRSLVDMYGKDGQVDPVYHAKTIDTQFPDMPFKDRQTLLAEVEKAKDPVEAEQIISAKRLERDTNELADTLIQGVDSDLLTPDNKLANAYQVLHQKAKELGVSESDLRSIAKKAMSTVGDQDQAKLIEELGLRLKTLEQDKAYEKRQAANAKQYRTENAAKRREQYQREQDAQARLRYLEMQQLMGR